MDYKCEIIETKDQNVLSIRTHVSVENLPPLIGQAYGKIMGRLEETGVTISGEPFVAYYNLDMENLDVEMGFPVDVKVEGKGEIQPGMIPGGAKAKTMHIGAYQDMAPAYETLTQYIKDQGREPTGVAYEYYLDPPEVPMEKTRTVIVFPLK
jgi:effector-binding domain-containing protein